jgi:hypothetical protein
MFIGRGTVASRDSNSANRFRRSLDASEFGSRVSAIDNSDIDSNLFPRRTDPVSELAAQAYEWSRPEIVPGEYAEISVTKIPPAIEPWQRPKLGVSRVVKTRVFTIIPHFRD